MTRSSSTKFRLLAGVAVFAICCVLSLQGQAQAPGSRVMGTVKSVSGNTVTVTLDSGTDATVTLADSARIVRATPGQTDLKSATPIQASDIHAGDRIAARGQTGEGGLLVASFALVMSKADIVQRQQQEREEWRKGVGGIVREINAAAGTITIPNSLAGPGKETVIHVSPQTEIRRYSPDSVKFEDSKPSTLQQIKVGDHVRARGTKNEDGTDFTAQAIVSGTFYDIAGTVISTDTDKNLLTVMDLATKKPVTVKIGTDSMLRKLPQFLAMGIAMRLKGINMPGMGGAAGQGAAGGNGTAWEHGQNGEQAKGQNAESAQRQGPRGQGGQEGASGQRWGGGQGGPGGFGGSRGGNGGPPDFQQMLARMPALPLTDLNKGDAVILVATEGTSTSGHTAITLLAGVEPILTAAPAGTNAAATVLSPWNLGTGGAGGGEAAAGP